MQQRCAESHRDRKNSFSDTFSTLSGKRKRAWFALILSTTLASGCDAPPRTPGKPEILQPPNVTLTEGAPHLSEPRALPLAIAPGKLVKATFTVYLRDYKATTPAKILISGTGIKQVAQLNDQGRSGDHLAGDGFYSATAEVDPGDKPTPYCLTFRATLDNVPKAVVSTPGRLCVSRYAKAEITPANLDPSNLVKSPAGEDKGSYVLADELLFRLKEGVKESRIKSIEELLVGRVVGVLLSQRLYRMKLKPAQDNSGLAEAMKKLHSPAMQEIIGSVTGNGLITAAVNDPRYDEIDDPADCSGSGPQRCAHSGQDAIKHIHAPEAWDKFTTTQPWHGQTIAILDSGLGRPDTNAADPESVPPLHHEDITATVSYGTDYINGGRAYEQHGHGTHVAGIAAATGDNSTGIAGVAWGSSLLITRVLDENKTWSTAGQIFSAMEAIETAAQSQIRIINASFDNGWYADEWCTSVKNATHNATTNAVERILVASAGNQASNTIQYPAGCNASILIPNKNAVIAVLNSKINNDIDPTSSYGTWVDLAAPGNNILSTVPTPSHCSGCNNDYKDATGYKRLTGTSMAAPMVAGAAAVLLADGVLLADVQTRLTSTSLTDISLPGSSGSAPLIDLCRAVHNHTGAYGLPVPQNDAISVPKDQTSKIDVRSDHGNGVDQPSGHACLRIRQITIIDDVDHGALTPKDDGSFDYQPNIGYTGPDGFTYSLSDNYGSTSAGNGVVSISVTAPNASPIISGDLAISVTEGGSVTLTTTDIDESDPDDDGDGLTWNAIPPTASNGHLALSSTPGTAISSFTQTQLAAGTVIYLHNGSETTSDSFKLRLSDGGEDGAVPDEGSVQVTVIPQNDPPSCNITEPNTAAEMNITDGNQVEFQGSASDPEDPAPSYAWVFPGGTPATSTQLSPGMVTFNGTGLRSVTFTATDAGGTPCSPVAGVQINVGIPPNVPPVPKNDAFNVSGTSPLTGDLFSDNGSGADSDLNNDSFTVSQVNGSAANVGGALSLSSGGTTLGSVTVQSTGTFTFTPQNSGNASFSYKIRDQHLAESTTTATVTIAVSLQKVGLVFLLDTSGSMQWSHNGTQNAPIDQQRLTLAKRAVKPLLDLIKDQHPGKAEVGISRFPLQPWSTCSGEQVQTMTLLDSSSVTGMKNTVDSLTAIGGTPMLAGMELALGMFSNQSSKALVLLSDGYHNCPGQALPTDSSVTSLIADANAKGIDIFSIGFGRPTDVDHPMLEAFAGPGDFTDVTDDSGFDPGAWIPATALDAAYGKILGKALGLQSPADPMGIIEARSQEEKAISITQYDRTVSFYLSWAKPGGKRLDFRLYSADNQQVNEAAAGVAVHHGDTYKIVTIYPRFLKQPGKVGQTPWRLIISAGHLNDDPMEYYQYTVFADSALRMDTRVASRKPYPGKPLIVSAKLSLNEKPITGIRQVRALISIPKMNIHTWPVKQVEPKEFNSPSRLTDVHDSIRMETENRYAKEVSKTITIKRDKPVSQQLYDDGTHGDLRANDGVYTTTYNSPPIPGTYSFLIHAEGDRKSPVGQFRREARIDRHLTNKTP